MNVTLLWGADHDYQPPCPNNIVDASKAVWMALEVPLSQWGEIDFSTIVQ